VTIVYLPCYLDGNDGVLNIAYYDMMPALDATVFPSYYEPWGYTPLESIAFGVPTISSDKAGFGQWILTDYANDAQACGAKVIARTDSNYDQAREDIADSLLSLIDLSAEQMAEVRQKAMATASDADWSKFIEKYIEAFAVAQSRRDERLKA
jgi:glycosyltransferase involved in cell wall biosynthesis